MGGDLSAVVPSASRRSWCCAPGVPSSTQKGQPKLTFLCGLINDYRSLSNYLKEFSDFIHWYEQMFDRKPFI